jgi:sulfate transport system ATP-binding protein
LSISVSKVSKHFGAFHALDEVSIDFAEGELTALLGPSGCGKTTLLRIIAGLERPDSGRVVIEGEDTTHRPVRERGVGFVFQHYALFRHMTVFDNVAFGLRMRPRAVRPTPEQIRERVMKLLALVQLDWLAGRFPAQLSGGQRQRIALARALAVEPRVLLLDEPFGALDAKVRRDLRRWLRNLHDEIGVTSIFVTHDQDEAMEVADRIVVLNHGRIEQVGAPEDLYRHPVNAFVHQFVGQANVIEGVWSGGVLEAASGGLRVEGVDFPNGTPVLGFVRPHDFDVLPDHPDAHAQDGVQARILRRLPLGPLTRLELVAVQGGQVLEVDVPIRQSEEPELGEGALVRLLPRRIRVFSHPVPTE